MQTSTAQESVVARSKMWWLTVLLSITFLSVVGQQTSVLFGSIFAVYGRWVTVGLWCLWAVLYLLKGIRQITVPVKWGILVYCCFLWMFIAFLLQQTADWSFLIRWMIVPLGLMMVGFAVLVLLGSTFAALNTLNATLLIVNFGLVVGSLVVLVIDPSSAFYSAGQRLDGIFTKPQGLSWAAANIFGWAAVTLSKPAWRAQSRIPERLLWLAAIGSAVIVIVTEVRGTLVGILVAFGLVIVLRLLSMKWAMFYLFLFTLVAGLFMAVPESIPNSLRVVIDSSGTLDLDATLSGRFGLAERSFDELRQNSDRLWYGTGTREDLYLANRDDYVDGGWHDPFAMIHKQGLLGFLLYNGLLLAPIALGYWRVTRSSAETNTGNDVQDVKDDLGTWIALFLMIRMYISSLGDSNLVIGHLDHAYYWIASGILIAQLARPKNS